MTFSTTEWLILAGLAILIVAFVVFVASRRAGQRRHAELKQRFGPEYERAVAEYGSVERAERELFKREKRVEHLKLRELTAGERTRFVADWGTIQARFVDAPSDAVKSADHLIKTVMRSVGYPVEDFERRVKDLSVDHANVVQHYRAARALADANQEGRANTEELRQAFVHYRALFSDLLQETAPASRDLRPARA